MNYRHPDGWQQPPRAPQHAAPPSFPAPGWRQAHRALRLFVTAGMWAAGLCLVVGSIVLVATAAMPGRPGSHATSAAQSIPLVAAQRRQSAIAADSQPAPARALDAFSGRGDATTRGFKVRAGALWELRWSYRCPASLAAGLLVVEDAARQPAQGANINWTGADGDGETWLNPSGGRHYLMVISACSWKLKVVQPK